MTNLKISEDKTQLDMNDIQMIIEEVYSMKDINKKYIENVFDSRVFPNKSIYIENKKTRLTKELFFELLKSRICIIDKFRNKNILSIPLNHKVLDSLKFRIEFLSNEFEFDSPQCRRGRFYFSANILKDKQDSDYNFYNSLTDKVEINNFTIVATNEEMYFSDCTHNGLMTKACKKNDNNS